MKPGYYMIFTNKQIVNNKNYYAYRYVRKRGNYLKKVHSNLMQNNYEGTWFKEPGIKVKKFIPLSLRDVTSNYQELISVVCEYFSCRAIWVKVFPKGTLDPIQTFMVVGHVPDVYMCHKFLNFEINNIQSIHFQRILYLRKLVRKYNRQGVRKTTRENVRTIASKYIKRLLYNIARVWEKLLESRDLPDTHYDKISSIYSFIRENKLANFGKRDYKFKPKIERAFCRENRFTPKKIIVYKKVTPFVY